MFHRKTAISLLTAVTLGLLNAAGSSSAAEETADQPKAKPMTTVDKAIPIEQLRVMVKPLTKAELQVETDGWFDLLCQKARQIAAAQLGVKKTNEAPRARATNSRVPRLTPLLF